MKKKLISESEARLLMIVLALAIVACAYFFGFNKAMSEAKEIEASNVQQQNYVATLENMVARQAVVEKETAELRQNVLDIVAKYPSANPQEKAIYILQQMEDATGIHVKTTGFVMDNLISTMEPLPGDPNGKTAYGYVASLLIGYNASYDSYKALINYVKELDDRTTIPAISAAYDRSTGGLAGNVTINMYYITNTEKKYEEIPKLDVEIGVEDIFNTVTIEQ